MVVLLEGSPISTEELLSSVRLTIGFSVTSPTKTLLPRFLSLAGRPALGRVLVFPNFFYLRMMEATVFVGTFTAAIPSTSWLGFCSDMHFQLWDLMCVFPNHVQSIEFTPGGLQSSCRNISRMIQCLAKVFGPLELCDLLPHFRLQT